MSCPLGKNDPNNTDQGKPLYLDWGVLGCSGEAFKNGQPNSASGVNGLATHFMIKGT